MRTVLTSLIFIIFVFLSGVGQAQIVIISGHIFHKTKLEKMGDVNIFETTSGIGTISNSNGFYKLFLDAGEVKLIFSETGFKPYVKSLHLQKDTVLNIHLEPVEFHKSKIKKAEQQEASEQHKSNTAWLKRKITVFSH